MNNWQLEVVIALVKVVLRSQNIDIRSLYDEDKVQEDINTLITAVIRSEEDE